MSANPNAGTQMFYVRQSDGLAYCFSPVPFIQDSKQILTTIKDGVETRLGVIHTLSFNGTLLPNKPALSGIDPSASCLEILDRKSDQLCKALNEDRGNLLIVDASGYPVLSVFPKVTSIDFPESQMVQKRDYSLTFEYEEGFNDDCKVSEFDDTWDFSAQEDDTISVSHSVSAVGVSELDGTGAIDNAKTFVLARADTLDTTQYAFLTAPFVPAIVDADNLIEFNHIRTENINQTAGSYGITETWVMASGNFKDDRTIDNSYELNELGVLVQTQTINGTVQGYGDTTFEKFDNAVAGFNNSVAIEIGFFTASGVATKSTSENRFAGTVNYSMTFDVIDDNPLEGRQITYSLQRNEDATTTQTVTTTASVRLASDSGIQSAIDFCFSNNFPIDSTVEPFFAASLSGNVESVSYQRDELAKSFSLTRVYREQGTPVYREEFQVSREQSLETATTTVTVNGTVQGMASELATSSIQRFDAASGAFFSTVQPLIRDRALEIIPASTCIGDTAIQTSLGYNKLNGTITYSARFDNRFLTSNPSIRDEKIDVNYTLPAEVIAIIPIPKKSDGPILQDQETVTGPQKTLKITYTMTPSGVDCGAVNTVNQGLLEMEALTESNILINNTPLTDTRGEKPVATTVFRTADTYSFNRQSLVFTRSVTWQYTIG
jgi:hypothetical protein